MQSFQSIAEFYNKRFAYQKRAILSSPPSEKLKVSIVIPAYNEDLSLTLNSLANCNLGNPSQIEVLVIINHSENVDDEIVNKHISQFNEHSLEVLDNDLEFQVLLVPDLPKKHAGVGLARKIGMDEALKRFQSIDYNGLIVCLDADCKVSPNYLESLLEAESKAYNGLSLYYEHPFEIGKKTDEAIVNYEIFLRYYSLALHKSSYPYYFQTVGSSMACRADIYAKIGGMNRRKAGEDFYFLHKVFPQGNFRNWSELTVYPSSRKSTRVPFGTGKAMIAIEEKTKDYSKLYDPKVFEELSEFFNLVEEGFEKGGFHFSSIAEEFLTKENLKSEFTMVKERSRTANSFNKNFFYWFDGFKVLKFIHFVQEFYYPDISNLDACSEYLNSKSNNSFDLLLELRDMEKKL